jgi:TatD DNase family protein
MPQPLFTDSNGREVAPPDLGGPIADTHAHLDMLDDPGLALANAARAHVCFVATVVDPSEDASRTFDELPLWFARAREVLDGLGLVETRLPHVRAIVGVHPHNAKNLDAQVEAELTRLARHALTAAIGEIGLDYHYDYSPRDVQREAFRRQLRLAHQFGLPVVERLMRTASRFSGTSVCRRQDAFCTATTLDLSPWTAFSRSGAR